MGIIKRFTLGILATLALASQSGCVNLPPPDKQIAVASRAETPVVASDISLTPFQASIQASLEAQIASKIHYIDAYYDDGEPPKDIGVCTDVVVRSFRAAGIDLQSDLFTDEKKYPHAYKSDHPDRNIDHRRCTKLIVYFRRHSKTMSSSGLNRDWMPGDIVFYDTGNRGKIDHVAVLSANRGPSGNYQIVQAWPGMIVHKADTLFSHKIVGHFRWNQPS